MLPIAPTMPILGSQPSFLRYSTRLHPIKLTLLRYLCLFLTHVACRGHLDAILDVVQASLSYDPNYADDMEEDEDEDGEEDEDE